MENHPIPQDVTGFKFKIIGSITIKQFAYLLAAGIFAAIILFLLPISGFIKIPLAFLFSVAGVGLAFIPIDGRPMDMMLANFAKAVQAETRFVYRKTGSHMLALDLLTMPTKPVVVNTSPTAHNTQRENKRILLQQAFQNSYTKVDDENAQAVGQILSSFNNPNQMITRPTVTAQPMLKHTLNDDVKAHPVSLPTQQTQAPASPTPLVASPPQQDVPQEPAVAPMEVIQKEEAKIKMETQDKVDELAKPNNDAAVKQTLQDIQKEIQEVQTQEQTQGKSNDLEEKIKQLQQQLNLVLSEKESLEKKMYTMVNKRPDEQTFTPSNAQTTPPPTAAPSTPNATIVNNTSQQFQAGFPTLPDIPNVVLGIVKDPRGKVMPNVLVEVVDPNDVPVRAFKTNALGQFASATPLSNGSYKVIFEDPQKKHEFDTIEITLDGKSIFNPIEVTSVDQREKLRRELFTAPIVTN